MKKVFIVSLIFTFTFAIPLLAQVEGATEGGSHGVLWGALAAAFAIGMAAFAGSLGQGKAIAAACEGMARNPGAAGPIRIALLLGLAFIESLVIYALLIAIIAVGKG